MTGPHNDKQIQTRETTLIGPHNDIFDYRH